MDTESSKTPGLRPAFSGFLGVTRGKLPRQVLVFVILLASMFVACWTSITCLRGYTTTPWWDQWHFVDNLQRGFVVSDLVASFVGHRLLLARLIFLADLRLFGLSNAPLVILNWIAMIGILGLFIRMAFTVLRKDDALIATAFAAALVCSGFQISNLIFAWDIQIFLLCLFTVAAFVCLAYGRVKLAIACGLLSTASMASGLMVWPVLLWQAWQLRSSRRQMVVLAICGAASWGLYLWDHDVVAGISGMGYQAAAARPLDALTLAAFYFGCPIGLQQSITLGILAGWIAGFGAWRLIRARLSDAATAYAAVVLWVMLTAITTAVARMRIEDILPPNHSGYALLGSQYMTMALTGWTALVGLALSSSDRWARWPVLAAAAFLAFGLIPREIIFADSWVNFFHENERIGQKMVAGETLTLAEAGHLYDHTEDLPRLVGYLAEHHLMCFAGKAGGSFHVLPTVTIASISPASPRSGQAEMLIVNGTNFERSFRATLSVGTWTGGVPPEALTYVSPTEVRASIFFGAGGPYTATLTVINPDHGSASIPFTVR
jgi:hypothetical protein